MPEVPDTPLIPPPDDAPSPASPPSVPTEVGDQATHYGLGDVSTDQMVPRLGRFELLGQIGRGGMGTVWLARDVRLDRRVALKLLPTDLVDDEHAVARFRREAQALAKVSHPGIVQVHDA